MSVECALCKPPTLNSRFQKGVSICTGAGIYGGSDVMGPFGYGLYYGA